MLRASPTPELGLVDFNFITTLCSNFSLAIMCKYKIYLLHGLHLVNVYPGGTVRGWSL